MWKTLGKWILKALKQPAVREQLAELIVGQIQKKRGEAEATRPSLPPDLQPTGAPPSDLSEMVRTARWMCPECSNKAMAPITHASDEACPVTGYRPDLNRLQATLEGLVLPQPAPQAPPTPAVRTDS